MPEPIPNQTPLNCTCEDVDIPDFCDMDKFDQILKNWATCTGLATVAVGRDGHYISDYYNFTEFCSEMNRKSAEGLKRCIDCDKKGNGIYCCHAGLVDFSSPITLEDGTVLGRIVGGQVLPEKPNENWFRALAKELSLDQDSYIEALRHVNVRARKEIQASYDLLSDVVTMFVRASYAAYINSQSLLERAGIILSLSKIYFTNYYLDLVTNQYQDLDEIACVTRTNENRLTATQLLSYIGTINVLSDYQKDYTAFIDFETLSQRMAGRQSLSFEFPARAFGWCRATFIPVDSTKDGQLLHVLFVIQKIQEEKEKELKTRQILQDAAEDANRANLAKTDFLSRMSHDIRTPLNGIVGMTYLAKQEPNPPKTVDYLNKIDTSSKFLLGLINDILDMTKAEKDKIVLHPEPYPMSEFLGYLDSVIRPLCEDKNIHFVVDVDSSPDRVPVTDKLRYNQIVFNLLSNAVKFTPEGGTVTYREHYSLEPGTNRMHVIASVKDTGIGMSPEFQKILFTPFNQEDRIDNATNRGTGLGLAICKHMVTLMGGTIDVESQLGHGTTFTFTLDYDTVPAEAVTAQAKPATMDTDHLLAGKHVLLFEDHPLNQEIAKALLEKKGMVVELAENGQRGLAKFAQSSLAYYDLILMDIRMPVMDGYEATKALRALARPDAKKVPIIAMTADAFNEDIEKCHAVGMNDHIAKPIEPSKLYETLARALEEKK
ncbi:MAG: PocR ligand-binding domain-containing protein [Bacilli bacterium]|jgi:signal transduction histidine kinase/ActR/RegA family two-component response regulator|nr:PocR ligand-binding domain-containing protein [Bacilli bacterium]